jgi:glycosyltransferase involved in cell wall biosynthesis
MIVALNTPFKSEVLDNGRYGIQFEGDVEDFWGKLQFVEDNPAKTNKCRQRGPEQTREKYNWEQITKK